MDGTREGHLHLQAVALEANGFAPYDGQVDACLCVLIQLMSDRIAEREPVDGFGRREVTPP